MSKLKYYEPMTRWGLSDKVLFATTTSYRCGLGNIVPASYKNKQCRDAFYVDRIINLSTYF